MNLLYLPVIKLNQQTVATKFHASGSFMVAVDAETEGTTNNNNRFSWLLNKPVQGNFGETLTDGVIFD